MNIQRFMGNACSNLVCVIESVNYWGLFYLKHAELGRTLGGNGVSLLCSAESTDSCVSNSQLS